MSRYGRHRNAAACPPFRNTSVTVPGCGGAVAPACDVSMNTNVIRNTAAGVVGTLAMVPQRTTYFQPLVEKLLVIDNATPDTNRRVEITTIEINGVPQEPFSAPAAAALASAALSDFFGAAFDGYGKEIAYGVYTVAALPYQFTYQFVNIEAVAVDVYASHFGNSLDVLPPGCQCGVPFAGPGSQPPPNGGGGGGGVQTAGNFTGGFGWRPEG